MKGETGHDAAEERITHDYCVAHLVPSYGEQLEWINDNTRSGDIPQGEQDHSIDNNLQYISTAP